ncbi:hypothetical protein, partial [Escherichia coli]|uniref:hypothetical protein n=3 Tax=Escherichia coli TaxID=562 RepID=UPI001A7EE338
PQAPAAILLNYPFPANRFYPQRQIEYTTSATAIAIPTVVNASGQVIDSPPAAVLVATSSGLLA